MQYHRDVRRVREAVWCLCLVLAGDACASGACSTDRQCDTLHYCAAGSCRQDCTRDVHCAAGMICSSTGRCVGGADAAVVDAGDGGRTDAGREGDAGERVDAGRVVVDGGRADAGPLDGGRADAGRVDGGRADGGRDAGRDGGRDAGRDAGRDGGRDAGRDAGRDGGRDAGTVAPAPYTYSRVAVGGLREAVAVSFHPTGSYAVVLERSDGLHIYDWASATATRVDVRVGGRAVYLDAIEWSLDGSVAWIVGYERVGTTDTGVVIALDDARWRAGDGAAALSRLAATASGERFSGIARPRAPSGGPAGDGRPVVLSQSGTSPYVARLRELDPATGAFAGLFVARATSAGCDDVAFANNEFGGWGLVLACGTNGAEVLFYTSIAGVGEWRLGAGSLGNVSRLASPPSAAYALIVNWSSRYLHRFEAGALRPTGTSPGLATGIFDVSFSSDGRLALVTGRAQGSPLRGTVFEYRHDLWSAAEITDVSIEGFSGAPYLATSSTYLNDSAFRPGCDGGLVVGGQVSPSTGLLIEFSRAGGRACRP